MRGIVALVSLMTLMIVAGLILLAYGMATQIRPGSPERPALVLPAGSTVVAASGPAKQTTLLVRRKGKDHIYVVNTRTSEVLVHMPVEATGSDAPGAGVKAP